MNIDWNVEEKWFRSLPPLQRLNSKDYERAIRYVNSPREQERIIDAIKEAMRCLAEIEANYYRNCIPGCYV